MKTKYIEILDLVLSNPANQLSKSSRDMLETMKNGLKIEKEDHSEEMEDMLNEIFLELDSLWDHEHNNSVFGVIDVKKIAELLNKVKDNG
ncbi:hypothetical protein CMU71_14735 [Elizabethkingia anophelis]|nr:hypothetical protein [Elizabethkingia anophelis]